MYTIDAPENSKMTQNQIRKSFKNLIGGSKFEKFRKGRALELTYLRDWQILGTFSVELELKVGGFIDLITQVLIDG